jgi:hypothetical protein
MTQPGRGFAAAGGRSWEARLAVRRARATRARLAQVSEQVLARPRSFHVNKLPHWVQTRFLLILRANASLIFAAQIIPDQDLVARMTPGLRRKAVHSFSGTDGTEGGGKAARAHRQVGVVTMPRIGPNRAGVFAPYELMSLSVHLRKRHHDIGVEEVLDKRSLEQEAAMAKARPRRSPPRSGNPGCRSQAGHTSYC